MSCKYYEPPYRVFDKDDWWGIMPHSEQVKKYFKVNEWVRSPLNHIESKKIPSILSKLIMEADK